MDRYFVRKMAVLLSGAFFTVGLSVIAAIPPIEIERNLIDGKVMLVEHSPKAAAADAIDVDQLIEACFKDAKLRPAPAGGYTDGFWESTSYGCSVTLAADPLESENFILLTSETSKVEQLRVKVQVSAKAEYPQPAANTSQFKTQVRAGWQAQNGKFKFSAQMDRVVYFANISYVISKADAKQQMRNVLQANKSKLKNLPKLTLLGFQREG